MIDGAERQAIGCLFIQEILQIVPDKTAERLFTKNGQKVMI
jgi:hypothetical protein